MIRRNQQCEYLWWETSRQIEQQIKCQERKEHAVSQEPEEVQAEKGRRRKEERWGQTGAKPGWGPLDVSVDPRFSFMFWIQSTWLQGSCSFSAGAALRYKPRWAHGPLSGVLKVSFENDLLSGSWPKILIFSRIREISLGTPGPGTGMPLLQSQAPQLRSTFLKGLGHGAC